MSKRTTKRPPRLIDLHVDWLLQYAGETTVLDAAHYAGVADRLGQADGYLGATAAAVVSCYRRAADWASQSDPWAALDALLTRIEAEFPGRILADPADRLRWGEDPDGLTWAIIGVEGFDALVRSAEDLDRLPALVRRGVRLIQPVYGAMSPLAGSAAEGDDRGLADLGRAFLHAVDDAARAAGARLMLDLAHLNATSAADVLAWVEADADRPDRLIPVYSHGALRHDACPGPRAITSDNLARLRALGGVIGLGVSPPFYPTADELRAGIEAVAAIPFRGRPGFEGIAIGTDFLGVDRVTPGLETAPAVVAWLAATFEPPTAAALIHGNGRMLIERLLA